MRAVLGQQVSVAAARTLAARLVDRTRAEDCGWPDGLTHLFPAPAALAAANLDGLGITGARIAALHTLARAIAEGKLDFNGGVEDVTAAIAALPGFGAWTAQYVALRALAEPDAFPTGDLVLRRLASTDGAPLSITRAGSARRKLASVAWLCSDASVEGGGLGQAGDERADTASDRSAPQADGAIASACLVTLTMEL